MEWRAAEIGNRGSERWIRGGTEVASEWQGVERPEEVEGIGAGCQRVEWWPERRIWAVRSCSGGEEGGWASE